MELGGRQSKGPASCAEAGPFPLYSTSGGLIGGLVGGLAKVLQRLLGGFLEVAFAEQDGFPECRLCLLLIE